MLSHDWPQGIENHGNLKQLLKYKPFFEYVQYLIKYILILIKKKKISLQLLLLFQNRY